MLKNLLVHVPSERPLRPVIDVAVALAVDRQAHLDAVAIGYESTNATDLVVQGGAAVAAVMELERQRALERANAAIGMIESEPKLAEITYTSRTIAATPFEAAQIMGTLARLYDLTIMLQPQPSQPSDDNTIPQGVLFESGSPMLMIPYIHKGPLDARHVGIAWDGSRLAARALHDGWPFLRTANSVTLIAVNEEREGGEASTAAMAVHLARRGIHAHIERLTADRSNVHNAILSAATDAGIGLLVMGGYGHSRLQERILGGVTRGFFESTTVPTLMSH
jgi:nucleotide-binding universal stress UspA family protein